MLCCACVCRARSERVYLCRCWRERPADPAPERVVERVEEGALTRLGHERHATDADRLTSIQVLEYCEHHRGDPLPAADATDSDDARKRTTDISEWDQKFITVDQEMLFEIILAANYLDIKPLLYAVSTLSCLK